MTDEGLINLVSAIFKNVAQDCRYGSKCNKTSAFDFLDSDWFVLICDGCQLDAKRWKNIIIYNKVRRYTVYE
jgi:hypothetical protein